MESVEFESIFPEQLYKIEGRATIIVSHPWEKIRSEEKDLLKKILSAVRLSLDSVTIKYQPILDLSSLKISSSKVIYFGVAVNGLSYYEHIEANGISIVLSENLKDLLSNDSSRKKLWGALKTQFAV
jgi:DNA polymerase III psi subunit